MINDIVQWFNNFPSRKYALLGYLLLIVYALFITHIKCNIADDRELDKRARCNKRFVFCDGKKSNVIFIDMVNQTQFDNLLGIDEYGNYYRIGNAIIDRNGTSVYFQIQ